MEKTWDIVKTVAGAFIIVYAVQGGFELAKRIGKKEAYEEMVNQPHVECGHGGDPVVVGMNGKRFHIKFESID